MLFIDKEPAIILVNPRRKRNLQMLVIITHNVIRQPN